MKRVLKIVLLSFLCVIGAFGLAIGGMYLFGGFDEKIVYADNLYFSETQVVSSGRIFMQVNTTTDGVTRKMVKLELSPGGERIVSVPPEVEIGKTFTIIPIQKNDVNVGGNVSLTAYYDAVDGNLSAVAKCEILIDIPVEEVKVKMPVLTLKPTQTTSFCLAGNELSSALEINPVWSLIPYAKSNYGSNVKIDNIVDKTIFLQLVDGTTGGVSDKAKFYVNNVEQNNLNNQIKINYEYKNGKIVFKDNINIKAGGGEAISADVILKAYVYSTYKEQSENSVYDEETGAVVDVPFNTEKTMKGEVSFVIGSYEITNMTISQASTNVYLNEETKIYLNNPSVTGNDINLGVQLETDSEGLPIKDKDILNYVFINIDKPTYRILTDSAGNSVAGVNGLSAKTEANQTLEKSTWYWKLNVNNFFAYYDYENKSESFTVSIVYNDGKNSYERTFNLIPKIREIDSLSVKYETGKSSFNVRSSEKVTLADDNIEKVTKLPVGVQPTYSKLAYYISYDKNFESGKTTVSTIPANTGTYKAVFTFSLTESGSIQNLITEAAWGKLKSAVFYQPDKQFTITYNEDGTTSTSANVVFDAGVEINAEVIMDITAEVNTTNMFYITANEPITITNKKVKFYEDVEGDGIPYLTINSVRFYVNFDFYESEQGVVYLKIDDVNTTPDSYKVQGIGSFYITVQLVYNDNNTGKIYWLGKSTDAFIEVYEELSSLVAYQYDATQNTYNNVFGSAGISYAEDDPTDRYIFITSTEMDSLKNYIAYKQVRIDFAQQYGVDVSAYTGINTKNMDAVTFGSTWLPVLDKEGGNLVGYRISYKINPINSIYLAENQKVDNIFRIIISINVNGLDVYATFMLNEEDDEINTKYLDFEIIDKTITVANIKYDATGVSNAGTKEDPIELRANLVMSEGVENISWTSATHSIDFENNLKYYFGYSDSDTSGIITSMTYDLSVEDDSNVSLTNLYDFDLVYYEDSNIGKGGLKLYNFPEYLDASGRNLGVLLKITVYSEGQAHAFNGHWAWNATTQSFGTELVKNPGLSADIYFRVYGLQIKIESKQTEVFGCKDDEIALLAKNGTDNIFNITVANGMGNNIDNINDYSRFMTLAAMNQDVEVSEDYSKLKINDNFLTEQDVKFIFYVGSDPDSTGNAIRIKIGKNGEEDVFANSYSQVIKSAYSITTVNTFESPSVNQEFITIDYNKADAGVNIDDLLNISIRTISCTLSSDYGIDEPVVVNADRTLTFKTAPVVYRAVMQVSLTKKVTGQGEGNDTISYEYSITVTPSLTADNITLGALHTAVDANDSTYYYITAGKENVISTTNADENKKIVYSGKLLENIGNVSRVDIAFANKDTAETLNVNSHMGKTIPATGAAVTIWSEDLNYSKVVTITFTITFKDGGKFVIVKDLTILPNLTLELKRNVISSGGLIDLTSASEYEFIRNGVETELDLSSFGYAGLYGEKYTKDSFGYDSTVFTDVSDLGAEDESDIVLFRLMANYNAQKAGTTEESEITFIYNAGSYTLTFVLTIDVSFKAS